LIVVRKIEKARVNNRRNWRAPIAFHLENYRWLIKGEVDAGWISIRVDFVATSSDFRLQMDFSCSKKRWNPKLES
jgi:hypothetical protein